MQSFRIQPYWIVLKRKCFFVMHEKEKKLTHTHTITFLNAVCVVSRPLPECSLSVVSLVVFQQGSLNTLQLRFFPVVYSCCSWGANIFGENICLFTSFSYCDNSNIYFPFPFIPPVMDLPLKKSAIFDELLISNQIRHMLLFTYASVNKNALIFFLFKESRHVKRTAITTKTMFFFKNRPRY